MRDPEELHIKCNSYDPKDRIESWNQFCNLCKSLYFVDPEEFHIKCNSYDPKERIKALESLWNIFRYFPEKKQAWQDIHRLTSDQDRDVRWRAEEAIQTVFKYVPDKEQAWQDLIKLTSDQDNYVRWSAVGTVETVFECSPDKEQAWKDLIKLISDKDSDMRWRAEEAIQTVFKYVPDKEQAWLDLIKLTSDQNSNVRRSVAGTIGAVFEYVPDKKQAWQNLHRLTSDKDNNVRKKAAEAVGVAFQYIPDKKQAENDLHRLTLDKKNNVREGAAEALGIALQYISDKKQAGDDLHRLTSNKWAMYLFFCKITNINELKRRKSHIERIKLNSVFKNLTLDLQQIYNFIDRCFYSCVRERAARAIGNAFQYIPDKKQAGNDLHRLISDRDRGVRINAARAIGNAFQYIPDKKQAENDLHKLTLDTDFFVRVSVAKALGLVFEYASDKNQVLNDLHTLLCDEHPTVKYNARKVFTATFQYIPDKNQAWDELVLLSSSGNISFYDDSENLLITAFQDMSDKNKAWEDLVKLILNDDINDIIVKHEAVRAMGTSSFQYVSDTKYAWESLVKLTFYEDDGVKLRVVESMGMVFQYISDKNQAWEDLHLLTSDENRFIRIGTALALRAAFQHVPDKKQAWEDLVKLIVDEDSNVSYRAEETVKIIFQKIPDKIMAWENLHQLTFDKNMRARRNAAEILGATFQYLPSKELAWNDLDRLVLDINNSVRLGVVDAIGTAYKHVSNKEKALLDLVFLSIDEDVGIRVRANHYLGKICVYNASQSETEEEYLKLLASAIEFFEKSSKESSFYNPSSFCLPFYRSFYMIIEVEKLQAKNEVEQYLFEANEAVGQSKNKKLLLEAVENLARALERVQNLGNLNLETKKEELDFYRTYCEQAAELMNDTEEEAPSAVQLLRKGLPILDRKLKSLLSEIQEKAKIACRESQGTGTEEIAYAVSREVQKWEIGSQEEMTLYIGNFVSILELNIPRFPENEHIFKMINESRNQKDLRKLLKDTSELIEIIPKITIDPDRMKPTIGIITALPKEYAAVSVLLANKSDKYKIPGSGAGRIYCLGEIPTEEGNKHNLVLANAGMGNNIAATKASLLMEHFPNVKSIIMVGIAGGVPNPDNINDHVRLGDIVVSNEYGVIQYDNIKKESQKIIFRNPPRPPSASLLEAVKYLEAEEILGNHPWEKYIDQALSIIKTIRPSEDKDILYCSDSQEEIISHPEDPKRIIGQSRVFIGPIASANILQKDPKARDKLRDKFGVKAIEMEASGIADATWNHEVGYLVVRGICDYCDSHKNDEWQQYAAVVAAAYTRALIESMP